MSLRQSGPSVQPLTLMAFATLDHSFSSHGHGLSSSSLTYKGSEPVLIPTDGSGLLLILRNDVLLQGWEEGLRLQPEPKGLGVLRKCY